MSKLDEIFKDVNLTDEHRALIKITMLEVFGKSLKGKTLVEMGDIFSKEVREL